MNYYLDQEFHEYFKKPISWLPTIGNFNKKYHTIELISIGIVAEDGREYYAVCNEFALKAAERNKWLDENVLTPIATEFYQKESGYTKYHHSESLNLKNFLKWKGKSKGRISEEIRNFICNPDGHPDPCVVAHLYKKDHPIFYGYYADYDWVLFCSLFGTMMGLPTGFPMYCKDLQQMKDDWRYLGQNHKKGTPISKPIDEHPDYPKQKNEHHALSDAKWNFELHEFLKKISNH